MITDDIRILIMMEIMMKVKDIMNKQIQSMKPQDTLQSAARKMKSKHTGFIFIKEKNKLVGIVTDRDIVLRGLTKGTKVASLKLKDVMTKKVHFCFENDTIKSVTQSMAKNHIHRLPVLSKSKKLVGILSVGHIAHYSEQDAGKAIKTSHAQAGTRTKTGTKTGTKYKTKTRAKSKSTAGSKAKKY